MHRFVKNKSSITGGIILGFIILSAIILPMVMPSYGCYDVTTSHILNNGGVKSEDKLPPKLFPSGFGFWDGTIAKSDIVYDQENDHPVGYESRTISNLYTYESFADQEGTYGEGGYLNLTYKTSDLGGDASKPGDLYSYTYDYNFDYDYKMEYRFIKPKDTNYSAGKYRISLITLNQGEKTYYPLTGNENLTSGFKVDNGEGYVSDFSNTDGSDFLTIDISEKAKTYGLKDLENGRINIDVYQPSSGKDSVYIEYLHLSTTNDPETESPVSLRSIRDANHCMIQEQKISTGTIDTIDNPEFYRATNGSRSCLNVRYVNCNFTYDPYEDCYGVKVMTLPAYKINEYINQKWITYSADTATSDSSVIANRYKSLSDLNPIVEIIEQTGNAKWSNSDKAMSGYYLVCKVSQYKYLGYPEYPQYFFGTDGNGRDFLKTIATSLRLSLVIAFGCAMINIVIGLIWGSISGYFGGWTDIVMERIVDIVSGLPSIAIITLCILHLHNDMLAFIISMFMTGWMGVAARTRTQFYRFKGREYVLASRTLGARDTRLIFRHILPNSMGTIITSSILMIPSVIYSEASIAYLGLGLKNQLLFGVILSENRNFFNGYTMYLLIIPTVIMAFLLVSFNLFGNGLRDAFNPSLKGGE